MKKKTVLNIAYIENQIDWHEIADIYLNHQKAVYTDPKNNVIEYKLDVKLYKTVKDFLNDDDKVKPDIILLDIELSEDSKNSYEFIKVAASVFKNAVIFIFSRHSYSEKISKYIAAGAGGFISKSINPKMLKDRIVNEYEQIKHQQNLSVTGYYYGRTFEKISQRISKIIDKQIPLVHIYGHIGVGKTVISEIFQQKLKKKGVRFVDYSIAEFEPDQLDKILFGYIKGAFTGVHRAKTGIIEEANNGYLFLDNIDALPLSKQKMLLKCIEKKEIRKIGASKPSSVKFSLVTLSNKHLKEKVEKGKFLKNLYSYLTNTTIYIPPLSERRQEIPIIATGIARYLNGGPYFINKEVMGILKSYSWKKSNILELKNVLQAMVEYTDDQNIFHHSMIPTYIMKSVQKTGTHGQFSIDLNNPNIKKIEEDLFLYLVKGIIKRYEITALSNVPDILEMPRSTFINRFNRLSDYEQCKVKELLGSMKGEGQFV